MTTEKLQPISRDFEKALIALASKIYENKQWIAKKYDEIEEKRNALNLAATFEEENPLQVQVNKVANILDSYIDRDGDYIGPRVFAFEYKCQQLDGTVTSIPILCKVGPGETDGFGWLTGKLRIYHDFGFKEIASEDFLLIVTFG